MNLFQALLASCLLTGSSAFQVLPSTRILSSSRSSISELLAIRTDENAPRDYNAFVEWAGYYGISPENYQVAEQEGEWGVCAAQPASQGDRSLYVPAVLRLSSSKVRQEEFAALEPAIAQYFDATNSNGNINLACHFYLFLKVLQEYEQGEQSPFYAWLEALPRKFFTSVTFDEFEVQCLPPFVAYLSRLDRFNYDLFLEVLQALSIPTISDATKYNPEVTKWAFNVVFTRARAAFGEAEIIPMADMFNHNANPNVEVRYDGEGNVHVVFLRDVQAGEPMYKCYGQHTNPSRFLATYGFFDTSSPATYCKLMSGKDLTPELKDLGFVYEKMVFYVENGAIAEEVWDVMLYTILETIDPGLQRQFYDAHMRGDPTTKANLHQLYRTETAQALLEHVEEMLAELAQCAARMDQGGAPHKNIPMIRAHNDFVRETFTKVRFGLTQIVGTQPGVAREMVM